MKVICKNLERQIFEVDIELSQSLSTLLQKLQELYAIDSEHSTLIFSGKVLLDLEQTLESLNYKEGKWFVLYPRKLKVKMNENQTKVNEDQAEAKATDKHDEKDEGSKSSDAQNIRLSNEAFESLMEVLYQDQGCARLLRANPSLIERLKNPAVLVEIANRMGLDLTRFMHQDLQQDPESTSMENHEDENDEVVNNSDNEDNNRDEGEPEVLALPRAEVQTLTEIRNNLTNILGELPPNVNQYQLNTMIYESFIASDKDPVLTLNLLIQMIMDNEY